ncbi:MAG: hypothetical protein WCN92_11885 [Eubacteriales bacterium]
MKTALLIITVILVLALIITAVYWYKKHATKSQKIKVTQWLLWAVSEAEKQLGSNTGKLKLAMVYDMFLARFPQVARVMSFTVFSMLVDKALKQMADMIAGNPNIENLITGGLKSEKNSIV